MASSSNYSEIGRQMYLNPEPPPVKQSSLAQNALVAALVGIMAVGVMFGAFFVARNLKGSEPVALTQIVRTTEFERVQTKCNVPLVTTVADGGRTFVIAEGSTALFTSDLDCIFDELKMPTYVIQHVGSTRALDGQQSDAWPGYTARWTYHPNTNLRMTVQLADS